MRVLVDSGDHDMTQGRVCVHCGGTRNVSRPRGLCWNCYYTPGVKDKYPPVSKFATYGEGAYTTKNQVSKEPVPTDTLPGTEERFKVLEERARNGQALKHPRDAK